MRFVYPFETELDGEIVQVRFPDVPEAITEVNMANELLDDMAHDCLIAALRTYVSERESIPRPSAVGNRPAIALTALESAKIALAMAMQKIEISNTALAERLGVTELIVRRMLDLDHRNHIGQVEMALDELGWKLEISVKAA